MSFDWKSKSIGVVQPQVLKLKLPEGGLRLRHGGVLPEVSVAYEAFGTLKPDRSNVVFICHALTGDAHVAGWRPEDDQLRPPTGWWDGMVCSGGGIDTDVYYVVCANILGGCSGTTGPSSINPATGKPYGSSFPQVTMQDMVDVNVMLLRQLGFDHLAAVVGGSFGGMLTIDWIVRYPEMVDNAVVIAAAPNLNTQALAFDIIGRQAIVEDPNWQGGDYYGGPRPDAGLARARKLAHITYLSQQMMERKFGRNKQQEWVQADFDFQLRHQRMFRSQFQVESYLEHQGNKFVARFDANSYLHILRALDEFDIAETYGHGDLTKAVESIRARVLICSLSGDWLFTAEQQEELAKALAAAGKNVSYCNLEAPAGHDAFLTHICDLRLIVRAFMPAHRYHYTPIISDREHAEILALVPNGASVIDLGCGDGSLLALLAERKGTCGLGVELNLDKIIQAVHIGQNVMRSNLDHAAPILPSHRYDLAILCETLQVIRDADRLLDRLFDLANEAILAIPNFGHWRLRAYLCIHGMTPKSETLPHEWYNTPNIHIITFKDFRKMCRDKDVELECVVPIANRWFDRLMLKFGLINTFAEQVVVKIRRKNQTKEATSL
ncbi:MAG: homoserine O-acetyltransferase [Kiritimatiellia bacterium]|nr:homoserine O-acetyltransferase [Kiritimatiellia bacterium]